MDWIFDNINISTSMTLDKSKTLEVPVWLISTILSVLVSAFVVWGGIASAKSSLTRAEQDIEILRKEKVNRDEFQMVVQKLNDIDRKLDNINR